MRVLILCEVFPLVDTTRGRQMAKLVSALEQHAARHGMADGLLCVSGVAPGKEAEAERWVAGRPAGRAWLAYGPQEVGSTIFARTLGGIRGVVRKATRNAAFVQGAVDAVDRIVAQYRPDVLLTVSNPHAWHRVGLACKQRHLDLPWMMFFSDPIPRGLLPPPLRRHGLKTYYEARLSRRILSLADAIIGPNSYMLDWMELKTGVSLAGRTHVIPHCGLRYSGESPTPDLSRWLVHVGTLYKSRITPSVFQAVKHVAAKHPEQFRGLFCAGVVAKEVQKLADSLEMGDTLKVQAQVAPDDAVAFMAGADVNLMLDIPLPHGVFLASKFVDYAVNGRPILLVGPPRSPMRDYLERFGGGVCVGHRQEEIEAALLDLFVKPEEVRGASNSGAAKEISELGRQFLPERVAQQYFDAFHATLYGQRRGGLAA